MHEARFALQRVPSGPPANRVKAGRAAPPGGGTVAVRRGRSLQRMELGFETIGNATLIVHDREPLLATDPWVRGSAYFGSWGLSHEIPPEQDAAILAAPAVWFSHGHPDHLNPSSLPLFRDRRILLPDHVGGRIARGSRPRRVPGRGAPRQPVGAALRSCPRAVHRRLRPGRGAPRRRRRAARRESQRRAGPRVGCRGQADHQQLSAVVPAAAQRLRRRRHDQLRRRGRHAGAEPRAASARERVRSRRRECTDGRDLRRDTLRALQLVPSLPTHRQRVGQRLHHFGRTTTRKASVPTRSRRCRRSCATTAPRTRGTRSGRRPRPTWPSSRRSSATTGATSWKAATSSRSARYFRSIERLARSIDSVTLRVGGVDHPVDLGGRRTGRSITFAVPRASLMRAIEWEIFDDLLIGNFMQATLHGKWPSSGLYPGFTPYVTKYADNGRGAHVGGIARLLRRIPSPPRAHCLAARRRGAAGEG